MMSVHYAFAHDRNRSWRQLKLRTHHHMHTWWYLWRKKKEESCFFLLKKYWLNLNLAISITITFIHYLRKKMPFGCSKLIKLFMRQPLLKGNDFVFSKSDHAPCARMPHLSRCFIAPKAKSQNVPLLITYLPIFEHPTQTNFRFYFSN